MAVPVKAVHGAGRAGDGRCQPLAGPRMDAPGAGRRRPGARETVAPGIPTTRGRRTARLAATRNAGRRGAPAEPAEKP